VLWKGSFRPVAGGWDSLRRECLVRAVACVFVRPVLCVYACCAGSSYFRFFWCSDSVLSVLMSLGLVHEGTVFQDHAVAVTSCVVSWVLLLLFGLRMT
jgi:hypothetical protein